MSQMCFDCFLRGLGFPSYDFLKGEKSKWKVILTYLMLNTLNFRTRKFHEFKKLQQNYGEN